MGWSWYFYATPMVMLGLGLYTFLVCIYGFLISTRESKGLISLIAVFLSVAFLGQIFSVFTAIELRYKIRTDRIPSADTDRNMKMYLEDESVRANWDWMQRDLRSCGGTWVWRGQDCSLEQSQDWNKHEHLERWLSGDSLSQDEERPGAHVDGVCWSRSLDGHRGVDHHRPGLCLRGSDWQKSEKRQTHQERHGTRRRVSAISQCKGDKLLNQINNRHKRPQKFQDFLRGEIFNLIQSVQSVKIL